MFNSNFFGKSIVGDKTSDELLNPEINVTNSLTINLGLEAFMLSDVNQSNELFKSRKFIRFKDFKVKSRITISELDEIKKDVWEIFLRLYSLFGILK